MLTNTYLRCQRPCPPAGFSQGFPLMLQHLTCEEIVGLAGAECWFLVPMEGKSCLLEISQLELTRLRACCSPSDSPFFPSAIFSSLTRGWEGERNMPHTSPGMEGDLRPDLARLGFHQDVNPLSSSGTATGRLPSAEPPSSSRHQPGTPAGLAARHLAFL